jgi:hypothetical protein
MFAGFAGLVSLIIREWRGHTELPVVTYAFAGITVGFSLVIGIIGYCINEKVGQSIGVGAFGTFVIFSGLAAFYCDWALGAMADNLFGTPSGDSATLYWSYFVLKRLTMFSF